MAGAILDALAVAAGLEDAGEKGVPEGLVLGVDVVAKRLAGGFFDRVAEFGGEGLGDEFDAALRGDGVEDFAGGLDVGAPAGFGAAELLLGLAAGGDVLEHGEVVGDAAGGPADDDDGEDAPDDFAVAVDVTFFEGEGVAFTLVDFVVELFLSVPVVGVGGAGDVVDVGGLFRGEADEFAEALVDVIGAGLALVVDFAPAEADGGVFEEELEFAGFFGEFFFRFE